MGAGLVAGRGFFLLVGDFEDLRKGEVDRLLSCEMRKLRGWGKGRSREIMAEGDLRSFSRFAGEDVGFAIL